MGYKQDLTKLESKSVKKIVMSQDLQKRHHFESGAILVLSSSYEDFTDTNCNPTAFFLCRLAAPLTMAHFENALNAETFRSPQVLRHRLRAFLIANGCEPLMRVPPKALTQVLNMGFLFHTADLEGYRLIPFGEKLTKWIGDGEVVDGEFEPVKREPTLPEAQHA